MRFVEKAEIRPSRCAVFPHIPGNHPRGFFDTGSELDGFDNHVYISVVAAEEMARALGWTPPAERQELEAKAAGLQQEVDRLTEELHEADRYVSAVDVLESKGFRARKKPGRPRKQEFEEAA